MIYSEFDVLEQLLRYKTCKLCEGGDDICCYLQGLPSILLGTQKRLNKYLIIFV